MTEVMKQIAEISRGFVLAGHFGNPGANFRVA